MFRSIILLIFLNFTFVTQIFAVREGSANCNIMIQMYKQKGDFGKVALWHETAAKCIDLISIPILEITIDYANRKKSLEKLLDQSSDQLSEAKDLKAFHLKQAKINWEKSETSPKELNAERKKIDRFIETWMSHYPDHFFDFGIYAIHFRERIEKLMIEDRFSEALRTQADAEKMCANWYERLPIAYFKTIKNYQKGSEYQKVARDHRMSADRLIAFSAKRSENWNSEKIEKMLDRKKIEPPKIKKKLSEKIVLKIARSNAKIKAILKKNKNVRKFAWFQGFCWTVSYYDQGWKNLAIVLVSDEKSKILEVIEDLEPLE